MLLVKTYIGPSNIHGLGLFAANPITKGTIIWRFDERIDRLLDKAQVEALPDIARAHLLRCCGLLENGKYLQTGDNDRFINHCGQPNTISLPGTGDMLAAMDIESGEEITEDYRTFDFSEERKAYAK